jgi:hypothetical protein
MNIEKIEIKPNQFVWVDKDTVVKDVKLYIGKWHLEKGLIINKFPTYLTDLSECKIIIAASPELYYLFKNKNEIVMFMTTENSGIESIKITDNPDCGVKGITFKSE